jgi:hypothetical protein
MSQTEIHVIQQALATVNSWGLGHHHDRTVSHNRDSGIGEAMLAGGIRAYADGVIINGTVAPSTTSNTGKTPTCKVGYI